MKDRNRAIVRALTSIGALLLLSGCDTERVLHRQKMILANIHVAGYPTAEALRYFAERAAEEPRLSENLTIDLQLGGTLGNEKEVLEKLRKQPMRWTDLKLVEEELQKRAASAG